MYKVDDIIFIMCQRIILQYHHLFINLMKFLSCENITRPNLKYDVPVPFQY